MALLDNFSEGTQNSLERAFLKCSLFFTFTRHKEIEALKGEMFLQMVLALLVEAAEPCRPSQIVDRYKAKTGRMIDENQVNSAFVRLQKMGWITPNKGGFAPNGRLVEAMTQGVAEVTDRYVELIDYIVRTLEVRLQKNLTIEEKKRAKDNIQKSLSLYARLHGLENVVGEDEKDDSEREEENEDIINCAKNGLVEQTGNLLVEILGDVIAKPTAQQAETIDLLMQSFIAAQIMQIDPLLGEFEAGKLKEKTFVFDTDFVLNCITSNHSVSGLYRKLVKTLRKIGCEIVIPQEVVEEVVRHAERAEGNNGWFQHSFESLDAEYVESEATNVFVKDYYMWKIKTKKNESLRTFMSKRYYDPSKPHEFMKDKIESELHCKVMEYPLEVDCDFETYRHELTEKIIKEAKKSPKYKWRDDQEAEYLAKTDAVLYLYAMTQNKSARRQGNSIMSADAYLITYTTQSIRCAKKMKIYQDIITRPEILINILQRIGEFDSNGKSLLNLFDNPFLTYIMRQNWPIVKQVADLGVDLHGKCITRLKLDLEESLHDFMTAESENDEIIDYNVISEARPQILEKFFSLIDAVENKKYAISPVVKQMVLQYKEKSKELESAVADKKKAEERLAEKAKGYQWYLNQREFGKNIAKVRKKRKFRR